jgi:hypothetical protein
MHSIFLQADTTPPNPAPSGGGGGGGGITINFPTIDWSTLIPQLTGYFFDAIGKFLNDSLHSAFDGLWGSGANVLGQTDPAMTWGFAPVHDQVVSVQSAARIILVCALIFLGLRGMLSSIVPPHSLLVTEFVNGIVAAIVMVAAFPLLIPQLIDMTNQAASAVGRVDLSAYMSTGSTNNLLIQGVLFIILLFFAIRLLVKAIWRIGFLAVLLPVGILACALYALPQTRWLLGWWCRVWGGMLLAQVPSVMALSIGVQLFVHGSGLGAFVYSIAFLQLAADLYSLIPFGSIGASAPPWGGLSLPMPFVLGSAARAAGGVGAVAGVANSVVQTATAAGSLSQTYGYR